MPAVLDFVSNAPILNLQLTRRCFLLVRYPSVLQKLREEITATKGLGKLNRTALNSLPYLQNILKESESPC